MKLIISAQKVVAAKARLSACLLIVSNQNLYARITLFFLYKKFTKTKVGQNISPKVLLFLRDYQVFVFVVL